MIIRVKKEPGKFFTLHKCAIMDPALSWKAKGLHAYLMSLPNDWIIRIKEIAKYSGDGISVVRSAIHELIEHGYGKAGVETGRNTDSRGNEKDSQNRFSSYAYTFFETPAGKDSMCEFLVYGKPHCTNNIRYRENTISSKRNRFPAKSREGRLQKFCLFWRGLHFKLNPELYPKGRPLVQDRELHTSIECLEKLCRIDGFDWKTQVKPALKWAAGDSFWRFNLRSLASLRAIGKNGSKKFENIHTAMVRSRPKDQSELSTPEGNEVRIEFEKLIRKARVHETVLRRRYGEGFRLPSVHSLMERWEAFIKEKKEQYRTGGYSFGDSTTRIGGRLWNEFINKVREEHGL